ncbi:amino acid permease, partial [Legionella pneumophila serogroup 1]
IAAMIVGFIPPSQIPIKNVFLFECFLIGGLILFVFIPWLFAKKHDEQLCSEE